MWHWDARFLGILIEEDDEKKFFFCISASRRRLIFSTQNRDPDQNIRMDIALATEDRCITDLSFQREAPPSGTTEVETGTQPPSDVERHLRLFRGWLLELKTKYEEGHLDPGNIKSGWSSKQHGKIQVLESVIQEMCKGSEAWKPSTEQ